MAASENKKQRCATVIPQTWPRFETPEATPGMTASAGRAAWFKYLRTLDRIAPTPRVYRSSGA